MDQEDGAVRCGACPLCSRPQCRLVVLHGRGWLDGRSWTMCYACYTALRDLFERALRREALGPFAPAGLTEHEATICRMLGINAHDAATQRAPRASWEPPQAETAP